MKQIKKRQMKGVIFLLLLILLLLTGDADAKDNPLTLTMPNGQTYTIGQNLTELLPADRVEQSISGYLWHVYNSDYANFVLVAVDSARICGFYTNSKGFKVSNGIAYGGGQNQEYESFNTITLRIYYDELAGNTVHAVFAMEKNMAVVQADLDSPEFLKAQALENFDAVNAFRVNHGKTPLVWEQDAAIAAEDHSRDMAVNGYFSHNSLDGRAPKDRFLNVMERQLMAVGENIFAGKTEGIESFAGWVNSEGHRQNMLEEIYKYLGVGVVYKQDSQYRCYTTQLFLLY